MFNLRPKPQPKPIDLHLPNSWNALSTEQLEGICRLLIQTTRHDQQHPYAPVTRTAFLVQAFMEVAGLEPIGELTLPDGVQLFTQIGTDDDNEPIFAFDPACLASSFDCQFRDEAKRKELQTFDGAIRPICITLSEIMTLATGYDDGFDPDSHRPLHHDGQIEWLLKPSRLTRFPYPEYRVGDKVYHGPSPMMADMSWKQYRFSSNILGDIINGENMLLRLRDKHGSDHPQVLQLNAQLNHARANWLANLFTLPVAHIDAETQQPVTDYHYVSDQYDRNHADFLDFPDYKYQAVSLWWQGMMDHLSRVYPKIFARGGGSVRPSDALTTYTRSTATMMKYIGATESEVNNTLFSIILQHIQDMAENDRVKEISSRH